MKQTDLTSKDGDGQLNLFNCEQPPKRKFQRDEPQKVVPNSVKSYREELAKGTFRNTQQKIIHLLSNGGLMTRRQLAKAMGKEPSSICKSLSNLQENKLVEIGGENKCPTTGRMVSWFRLCRNDKGDG